MIEGKVSCAEIFVRMAYGKSLTKPTSEALFAEAVWGNIFIRNYRIFRRSAEQQCVTFCRVTAKQPDFLYFTFVQDFDSCSLSIAFKHVIGAIELINRMKNKQQNNYIVLVCSLIKKTVAQVHKKDILNLEKGQLQREWLTCYESQTEIDQDLKHQSEQQFTKLKQIIYHYIDTFGSRHRTNHYCDLQRHSTTSFDIRILLNTISMIVYQQVAGEGYNQIESSCWTCFEISAKDKLATDRKDIVLTGNGRILMLNIIFLDRMEPYVQRCAKETMSVLMECQKSFYQATVKIYRINNVLDASGIVYELESRRLTLPIVSKIMGKECKRNEKNRKNGKQQM